MARIILSQELGCFYKRTSFKVKLIHAANVELCYCGCQLSLLNSLPTWMAPFVVEESTGKPLISWRALPLQACVGRREKGTERARGWRHLRAQQSMSTINGVSGGAVDSKWKPITKSCEKMQCRSAAILVNWHQSNRWLTRSAIEKAKKKEPRFHK